MPAVIAAAIVGASSGAAFTFVYLVATVAINYGLSRLSQQLSGKPRAPRPGTSGRDVTTRGTTEHRQIIYGEIKAGGFIGYLGLSGIRNKYLHIVVVYAAHQCQEISDLWLDEVRAPSADINGTTGEVSTSAFVRSGASFLYAWKHLGTSAQTADAALLAASGLSPVWSTFHRGAGLAYVHFRLEYSEEVWPNGAPANLYALVKGRRLYDPRLDSTNGGSGSHRRDDATTWEWSPNWALCVRDYISGGSVYYDVATPNKMLCFGEDDDRIDDAYTIAAANVSDEACPIPDGAGGSTTQARYTCDTQLSCGDTHKECLETLRSAGAGNVSYVNGKYRISAGAFETPTVTLTEDDIKGPMVISTSPQGEDLYNMVTGTFYDELRDWQPQTFPSITNSSFEADDGNRRLPRNIELHATRNFYRAQRLAMLHLALSREKLTIHFTKLSAKAMQIAENETFMLTNAEAGFTSKVLRCKTFEFPPSGFPIMTAQECNSSRYATPEYTDYGTPDDPVVTTPQYDEPDTPLNFEAVSMREGIFFRWEAPTPINSNQEYVLYEHTSQTPFASAVEVWRGQSLNVFLERPGQTVRYYWLTAQLNGVESDPNPATNGLAAAPFIQGLEEFFQDSFEHQDYERFYTLREGTPTVTYPDDGENGGHVLQFEGHGWIASNRNIPYEPSSVYLMTVRARMTQAPTDSSKDLFFAGVEGVAADGTTLINLGGADSYDSQHYFANAGAGLGAVSLGSWVTFRGYLSGHGASPSPAPAPDISDPMEAYTGVRFIRPMLILNHDGGDGIMQVDYIKLEKVVQTRQIGESAATELAFLQAGNFSGASPSATLHDLSNPTTLEFTPVEDCTLIITGTFIGSKTGGVVAVYAYLNNITNGVIETTEAYQLSGTPTFIMVQEQFNLTAGKTYRAGMRAQSDSTGNTETYAQPITTQLELIKR